MSDSTQAASVHFGLDGMDEAEVRSRLERHAPPLAPSEALVRVDTYELSIPLEQDEGDEEVFEAYRRMAREWNVAEPPPLASHRPVLGRAITFAKRLLRRLIAFEVEPPLERQARFNRAALDLIGLLLAEIQRLRRRVRELEERGEGDG